MQRGINRNKHTEKNLCVTLVIYQESLHDTRSTKCKIKIDVTGMRLEGRGLDSLGLDEGSVAGFCAFGRKN